MKCYYHRDRDAIGQCRSCGKGLCSDCQVDLGKGLACVGHCEEDVRFLMLIMEQHKKNQPATESMLRMNRRVWVGIGMFLFLPGAATLIYAVLREPHPMLFILGALLFFGGLSCFALAWSLPRIPEIGVEHQPGDQQPISN